MTETRTVNWSVDGRGITKLVRSMYCFGDNRQGAMNILSCFDGMTEEQAVKVCVGDAYLTDMKDGVMGYVEEADPLFKHEYHAFLLNKEIRAQKIKEAEEAERKETEESARKNRIDYDDQVWINERNPYSRVNDPLQIKQKLSARGREAYESGIAITLKDGTTVRKEDVDRAEVGVTSAIRALDSAMEGMSEENGLLPPPSYETITVGRWNVPKNYLDRYANQVVRRIRGLIRMQMGGIVSIAALDPMKTYALEMERQQLHNAICDAIGVPHSELGKERTQDQTDFDEALDKYLDEHSGKLFNGD